MRVEIVRVPLNFKHPTDDAGDVIPGAHLEPLYYLADAEKPGYQIYENVSEGTPQSPIFRSMAELQAWLETQGWDQVRVAYLLEHDHVPSSTMCMVEFDLTESEQAASLRAMNYWATHWDWECSTLFGLELSDLQSVIHNWPSALAKKPTKTTALALTGIWRELLAGASAVPHDKVLTIAGITHQEAFALLERLRPCVDAVFQNG